MAELALLDMEAVSLTNALALVQLYARDRSPKYERAALKYLRRYMDEAAPSLEDVARTAVLLGEQNRIQIYTGNVGDGLTARPPISSATGAFVSLERPLPDADTDEQHTDCRPHSGRQPRSRVANRPLDRSPQQKPDND
jgi:hypothetical protein